MKTMKYTFYVSVVFTCASLAVLIIINKETSPDKIYDISLAIFGSALLAAVSALIAYFAARRQNLIEYYRCLQRTTDLLKKYRECDAQNIDSEIPHINLDVLKTIRTDNLIELKDRYDNINFLLDTTRDYKKFIYSSYDYIHDIEIMTKCDQAHLIGSVNARWFNNLNKIFIKKGQEGNCLTEYYRVADDMAKYLIKYRELMNRNICSIIKDFFITKGTYCFKNSIVDSTTFEKLDAKYHSIVKKIVLATQQQHNGRIGNGYIEFSGITLEEAKYLRDRDYLMEDPIESDGKITMKIKDKLYYYEHFLEKYNECFDPPLMYKRVTVRTVCK